MRELEYDSSAVPAMEPGRRLEAGAVTLADIMTDTGHYGSNSIAVRARVSAADGKRGINALMASRVVKLHWLASALGDLSPSI